MNWVKANRHQISVDLACKLRIKKLKHLPTLDRIRIITDFGPINSVTDGSMNLVGETLKYIFGHNPIYDYSKKWRKPKVKYHHIAEKPKFQRGQIVQSLKNKAADAFLINYFEWIIHTLYGLKNQTKAKLYEKGDASFTIRKIKPFLKMLPYEPEVIKWSHGTIKVHFYLHISDKIKKLYPLVTKQAELIYSSIGIEISHSEEHAIHSFKSVVPTHAFRYGYRNIHVYNEDDQNKNSEENSETETIESEENSETIESNSGEVINSKENSS